MKLGHLITSGTAAAVLVFFSGCANHLEDITKEIPENTREVMARQYILTPGKNTPDSSIFKVTLEQIENIRVTTYQVRKVSTICTPYEGWRESYEFLAGLGLFPIAVFSNVFSVFTFGIFPFSWSSELTKYAFDGMNPFMNFELQQDPGNSAQRGTHADRLLHGEQAQPAEKRDACHPCRG